MPMYVLSTGPCKKLYPEYVGYIEESNAVLCQRGRDTLLTRLISAISSHYMCNLIEWTP